MLGYILTYAGGIVTGLALVWLNKKSVEKAVDRYKKNYEKERQKLLDENVHVRDQLIRMTGNDAYRQGYEQGRLDPYDEAERFARAMSGKQNVKFGLTQVRNGGNQAQAV